MSRHLGVAMPRLEQTFSVCKLVDLDRNRLTFASTDALVYGNETRRLAHVELVVLGLKSFRVSNKFCGRGPADFQDLIEDSNRNMEESGTPLKLICREGFHDLFEATYFVTAHLWEEVEPSDAAGVLDEIREAVLPCLRSR